MEFCEGKDEALKLNLAKGSDVDEVTVFPFAEKAGDWLNTELMLTTVVAVVPAAKGLESNRDAATAENDGIADVVHGAPNILSDCSII